MAAGMDKNNNKQRIFANAAKQGQKGFVQNQEICFLSTIKKNICYNRH